MDVFGNIIFFVNVCLLTGIQQQHGKNGYALITCFQASEMSSLERLTNYLIFQGMSACDFATYRPVTFCLT